MVRASRVLLEPWIRATAWRGAEREATSGFIPSGFEPLHPHLLAYTALRLTHLAHLIRDHTLRRLLQRRGWTTGGRLSLYSDISTAA